MMLGFRLGSKPLYVFETMVTDISDAQASLEEVGWFTDV